MMWKKWRYIAASIQPRFVFRGKHRQTLPCLPWKQGCPGRSDALPRRLFRQRCHSIPQVQNDWTTFVVQLPGQL
eukprot:3142004-Pyramimonas_sp.AAC.1